MQPEYAGFWRRAAALLIDAFLFSIVSRLVPLILHRLSDGAVTLLWMEGLNLWIFLLAAAGCWVYQQGTPGQLMMGCYVVDANTGRGLGWRAALLRAAGYVISFVPLLLGFLWMAWDGRRQGWHDKLAGSVVLLDRTHERQDESHKSLEQLVRELR